MGKIQKRNGGKIDNTNKTKMIINKKHERERNAIMQILKEHEPEDCYNCFFSLSYPKLHEQGFTTYKIKRHLKQLEASGLIERKRAKLPEGQWAWYYKIKTQ